MSAVLTPFGSDGCGSKTMTWGWDSASAGMHAARKALREAGLRPRPRRWNPFWPVLAVYATVVAWAVAGGANPHETTPFWPFGAVIAAVFGISLWRAYRKPRGRPNGTGDLSDPGGRSGGRP